MTVAPQSVADRAAALRLLERRRREEAWRYFEPVPKQREFLASHASETMLCANTAAGKTRSAAYAVSRHLTGEYPAWWEGPRYDRPVTAWVLGVTATEVASGPQEVLLGTKDIRILADLGTGMIPKAAIVGNPTTSRSAAGGVAASARVKHTSGGVSLIEFKSADQGREALQAAAIDVLWGDEESPIDIWSECLSRMLRISDAHALNTLTPLKGETELYRRFAEPPPDLAPHVRLVNMNLDDCTWYSAEQKAKMIASWPPGERRARQLGLPHQGMGMVWRTAEEALKIPAMPASQIHGRFQFLWGVDFGIAHPFAAAFCAYCRDPDMQEFRVLSVIRIQDQPAAVHAMRMRQLCALAPVAWPHDGGQRERGSGEPLREIYRGLGLKMLPMHACDPAGHNSLTASVGEMDAWMRDGRFKVADSCAEWFSEYRSYHYDRHGEIVSARDDALSASRYAFMMRRFARSVPLGEGVEAQPERKPYKGFDLFTGEPF